MTRPAKRRIDFATTALLRVALAATIAFAAGACGQSSSPAPLPSSPAVGTIPPGTSQPATVGPSAPSAVASSPATPTSAPASATPAASPPASPGPTANPGVVARRIIIERLGIDLPVVRGDGVDAPLGKAAHYPGTGWPNGGTNIYLYAHARDGMFINLWNARVGDTVDLALADGSTKAYRISKVLPHVPWDAIEYLDPTPTEQLTLQTCTSYEHTAPRFIVIAVPAD